MQDSPEDGDIDVEFRRADVAPGPIVAVVEQCFTASDDEPQFGMIASQQRERLQEVEAALAGFDAADSENATEPLSPPGSACDGRGIRGSGG